MNSAKEIDIKNHTYYSFDDMINIKNLDPNKIKIHNKSNKNILIYHIAYLLVKALSSIAINSTNPLHLYINKINGYIEESNGNNYLIPVPTDESKDRLKKYEEHWNKIIDLIISITNNSGNYDEKYMKMKFDSDNHLPLKKLLIVVRSV